jgi:hypothetical protein
VTGTETEADADAEKNAATRTANRRAKLSESLAALSTLKAQLLASLQRGVELRGAYSQRLEAWQAASRAYEALWREARAGRASGSSSSSEPGASSAIEEISLQYSQFRRNAGVIEKYVFSPISSCARDPSPLSVLLELPSQAKLGPEEEKERLPAPPSSAEAPSVFSAAALRIAPSQDFRCPLLTPRRGDAEVMAAKTCISYYCIYV